MPRLLHSASSRAPNSCAGSLLRRPCLGTWDARNNFDLEIEARKPRNPDGSPGREPVLTLATATDKDTVAHPDRASAVSTITVG